MNVEQLIAALSEVPDYYDVRLAVGVSYYDDGDADDGEVYSTPESVAIETGYGGASVVIR